MRSIYRSCVLFLLCLPSSAWAQESLSLKGHGSADWGWEEQGPRRAGAITDVAINPSDPTIIAIVGRDGAVWLSVDDGSTWLPVLSRVSNTLGENSADEDVLREIEAFVDDLSDEIDEDDIDGDPDGGESDVSGVSDDSSFRDAADAARAELMGGTSLSAVATALTERPRIWFSESGWLAIARSDGTWVSTNLGGSWHHVLDQPITALTYLPERGLWVAGTHDGIRFAADPRYWMDAEDGTEGISIYDLSVGDEGVYAATSDGLWMAPDAQRWNRAGTMRLPIFAVRVDPDWEGGLWAVTDKTILRSDDGGATYSSPLSATLIKTSDLERVAAGHLVASGYDGAWESVDGGVTWMPIVKGLSRPTAPGIAAAGDALWLASAEGVFRMVPTSLGDQVREATRVEPWMPVGDIIASSVGREGLVASAKAGSAALRASYLLPTVRLEARFKIKNDFDWSASRGTSRSRDTETVMGVLFTWSPPGNKTRLGESVEIDSDGSYEVESNREVNAAIIGGSVFIGEAAGGMAATVKTRRRSVKYRNKLIEDISELYTERISLVLERSSLARTSVLDRTHHELSIQEIEARLDVLSDGAVTRWSITSPQ